MSKVVISYRRSDAPAMAGRICDHLKARYGADAVYMDIENIPIGIDFRDHIHGALTQAQVVVAVVGPKWLGPRRSGQARIMEESDPVRVEVESALTRKLPIVPVLVDDAAMPTTAMLPPSMQGFAFRNGLSVHAGADFHHQMTRLTRALDDILKYDADGGKTAIRSPLRRAWPWGAGAAAAAVIALAVFAFTSAMDRSTSTTPVGGPYMPPSPRSHWHVDGSTVFLEATGSIREFYFVEPSKALVAVGAGPGSLYFKGRKEENAYKGEAYVFAGRCGKFGYDAQGPILNDMLTVDLTGKAPRIDHATCNRTGHDELRLVFDFRYNR